MKETTPAALISFSLVFQLSLANQTILSWNKTFPPGHAIPADALASFSLNES